MQRRGAEQQKGAGMAGGCNSWRARAWAQGGQEGRTSGIASTLRRIGHESSTTSTSLTIIACSKKWRKMGGASAEGSGVEKGITKPVPQHCGARIGAVVPAHFQTLCHRPGCLSRYTHREGWKDN